MADAAPAPLFPEHLFMVGCGNMAGQMLSRWLACGLDPARVIVLRPSGKPVAPGVEVVQAFPAKFVEGTVVLLRPDAYIAGHVAAATPESVEAALRRALALAEIAP